MKVKWYEIPELAVSYLTHENSSKKKHLIINQYTGVPRGFWPAKSTYIGAVTPAAMVGYVLKDKTEEGLLSHKDIVIIEEGLGILSDNTFLQCISEGRVNVVNPHGRIDYPITATLWLLGVPRKLNALQERLFTQVDDIRKIQEENLKNASRQYSHR